MAVEIFTVSLSDESIQGIAREVWRMVGDKLATESNPPSAQTPQPAASPASAEQGDPWQNQAPPPQSQGSQPQPYQQSQQQNAQVPTCAHGPMRYVPAGVSQSTGRAYPAFYGCQLPRGAQGKCQSVPA